MNNEKVWWIGARLSDLTGLEELFEGGLSIIGRPVNSSKYFNSLEAEQGLRLDYNNCKNGERIDNFFKTEISKIEKQVGNIKIFFQDQLNFSDDAFLSNRAVYNNDKDLLKTICNKALIRNILAKHVPVVESTIVLSREANYHNLRKILTDSKYYIVQTPEGSGGDGTYRVSKKNCKIDPNNINSYHVVVSKYIENSMAVNCHIVVFNRNILVFQPSIQIILEDENNRQIYNGCDYYAINLLSEKELLKIKDVAKIVGKLLQGCGYRGCAGIDFLTTKDNVLVVEINPRIQASTALLNKNLLGYGYPSIQELHMAAFRGINSDIDDSIRIFGSMLLLNNDLDSILSTPAGRYSLYSPDNRNTIFSQDKVTIVVNNENLHKQTNVEKKARIASIEINKQIVSKILNSGMIINPAINKIGKKCDNVIEKASKGNIDFLAKLKFHLFSYGLKLDKFAVAQLKMERKDLTIRDGIAGGLELRLGGNIHINTPVNEYFALVSNYSLTWDENSHHYYILDKYDNSLEVDILPIPDFIDLRTSRGTPMIDVGQMFYERLSLEIYFGCINSAKKDMACQFCELGSEPSPRHVNLDDLKELVCYCENSPSINLRHILIGGGTPPETMWNRYFQALEIVKSISDKKTYMMIAPPKDIGFIKQLHEMGLNEIGMNLELYNRNIARIVMPSKGKIQRKEYMDALGLAVKLWGDTGNVRSILIVGLEPLESTLNGIELLSSNGILPILSPYRPILNTKLAHHPAPSPDFLEEVWVKGEKIANKHGLCLGPTCIACQNNTIAMPIHPSCHYY